MNAKAWFDWSTVLAHPQSGHNEVSGDLLAAAAGQLMQLHQRRRRLPADELDDTGWAILLEVFVADTLGFDLSVTQLRPVAGVSQTTLVRYIDALEGQGLMRRERSSTDKRLVMVRIEEGGRAAVARVLAPRSGLVREIAA